MSDMCVRTLIPGATMNLIRNEGGNVAIMAALCLSVIVGGASFGVETGYWNFDQARLQQASDAA